MPRFEDLTRDEKDEKAESWKRLASMCRREGWCPSTPQQQSSLCVHTLLAPSATRDSKQCVMCCSPYWNHRAKMAQLLTRSPQDKSPEIQAIQGPHAPLNPTFHTHFSIVTIVSQMQFFQQTTCILVVKINSHNKKTELSAGHLNVGADITPQDLQVPTAFLR